MSLLLWLRAWLLGALFFFHPSALAEWYSDTQGIMGTTVSVTLWSEDAEQAHAAIDAVMSDMRGVDARLSPYKEDSDISLLNRSAATKAQPLSDELTLLLSTALHYSRVSGGAFDVSFAALGQRFDYRRGVQPSASEREAAAALINYRHLDFKPERQTLRFEQAGMAIDLGGIAKGYAVDRAIQILKERGVSSASVSAGGDSRLLGDRRGRPWIVGIKHPRPGPNDEEAVIKLPLNDVAISTSGDYERYFIDDAGERVHHIINPGSGKSANELMSVTILGPQGIDTDALSTSVFVLGAERGLKLVHSLEGFDAIVIDRQGKVHFSAGLEAGNQAAK